jgi:hypothetical protein
VRIVAGCERAHQQQVGDLGPVHRVICDIPPGIGDGLVDQPGGGVGVHRQVDGVAARLAHLVSVDAEQVDRR